MMAEQVWPRADHRNERHDQFLADWINRRVGHLRKILFEIIVEQARFGRQHGNRRVGPHRAERVLAVPRHRFEEFGDILLIVTKRLLPVEKQAGIVRGDGLKRLRFWQVSELILRGFQPFLIRRSVRE